MFNQVDSEDAYGLEATRGYRGLEVAADVEFDALAKLAANVCGTQAALIVLRDEDKISIRAKAGLSIGEVPGSISTLDQWLHKNETSFVVEDVTKDEKFKLAPFVVGDLSVVFLAGFPLIASDGQFLGGVYVLDGEYRLPSDEFLASLKTVAGCVVNLLEVRKQVAQTNKEKLTIGKSLEFTKALFFVISIKGEIERFGKNIAKIDDTIKAGDLFFDHFEFLKPFNFDEFIQSGAKETKSIAFFQAKRKPQRFRFSAQRHKNFVVLMYKPLINSNYPISNYGLTLTDFPPEDYISEFLFLQQTSNRYLKESHDMITDLRAKNEELRTIQYDLDLVARFPKENPNPIIRIDYDYRVSFSNNAAGVNFISDFQLSNGLLCDEDLIEKIRVMISSSSETDTFTMVRNGRTYSIGVRKIIQYGYINIYATDITYFIHKLKIKEQENIELKNFYEFILNNIPADIAVFDHQHKYVFVNPNGIKDKNIRDFMIGKDDFDYCELKRIPTDAALKRRERFNEVTSSNQSSDWIDYHLTNTGEDKFVLRKFCPISDSTGRKYVIGYGVDVTEIKRAELKVMEVAEEIRESELKYKTLIETTFEIVQSIGLDGKFFFVNTAWYKTFGYTKDEVQHLTIMDLIYPDNLEECMVKFKMVLEGNSLEDISVVFRTKSGEKIYTVGSASPRFQDGKIIGTNGFFQNVTELRKREDEIMELNVNLEEKVMQRTQQLESAVKELDSFSYSVSHDLRSPLRAIDGWSLALLEDFGDKLDEGGIKYINRMRSESQRMGVLIDDLLNLSRVGRRELKIQPVDLSKLTKQIFVRALETSERQDVEFFAQEGVMVMGDASLLDIMLTNLIANAIKFSSKVEKPRVEFGLNKVGELDVYYLRDNGAGFNMNNASKLFGAFQRMHRQSDFKGTGIGLAIVQRIVRAHGGEIWAESEVDQGATFFFHLKHKPFKWN